jgi:hypothetical protein
MTKESQKEEEIELGSLFIIIGKGFSNLFRFIGSIFKGAFHFFILLLLFIKENFIKLAIATVIGGVSGSFIQFTKDVTYGADLQIQPNFKSARQLYNNVNYYNDLVHQKEIASLAKALHISEEDATTLKKFEIYPIKNGNDVLVSYDHLMLSVDTLTAKSYSFDNFKTTFTDVDYKIHNIHVVATKNDVFSKLDEVIISSVADNQFFNTLKIVVNENLSRTDSLLRKNLTQVDSLRRTYIKVLLEESKKQNTGTSIDLDVNGTKKITKELALFETSREINSDLKDITKERAENFEILNVISNFQRIGYEIKGIDKNYGFLVASLAFVSMVLFLLSIRLNNYLNNYKK